MKNKTFLVAFSIGILGIISLLVLRKQISPEKSLPGLWIGTHAEIDKGVYTPHPYVLRFGQDSMQQNYLGETAGPKSTWEWNGIHLKIDTNIIQSNAFQVKKDQLSFGAAYPQFYTRPLSVKIDWNQAEITKLIEGKTW